MLKLPLESIRKLFHNIKDNKFIGLFDSIEDKIFTLHTSLPLGVCVVVRGKYLKVRYVYLINLESCTILNYLYVSSNAQTCIYVVTQTSIYLFTEGSNTDIKIHVVKIDGHYKLNLDKVMK